MDTLTDLVFTGIDFGTTYSAIGYVTRSTLSGGVNQPKAIEYLGKTKIPTAILLHKPNEEPDWGQAALDEGRTNPEFLFHEFKREVFNPAPLRRLPDGRNPTARLLAKCFYERLRQLAEKNKILLDRPVICHPVGIPWAQQVWDIANEAGIPNGIPVAEPLAALYYANYLKPMFDDRPRRVLMLDFGGGTCDLFLLDVSFGFGSGRFSIRYGPKPKDQAQLMYHTTDGVRSYGGKDIDQLIVGILRQRWLEKYQKYALELRKLDEPKFHWRLAEEARKAKETLSSYISFNDERRSYPIRLEHLPRNTQISFDLSATEFEQVVRQDLEAKLSGFLNDKEDGFFGRNKLRGRDIERVILAGGSSRLPGLVQILSALCPRAGQNGEVVILKDPEMSVAYGAALYNYYFQIGELPVPIMLEDTLWLEVDGRLYELASRNERLPYFAPQLRASHFFQLQTDSDEIELSLYVGESGRLTESRKLGESRVLRFSERLKAGTLFACQVQIDQIGHVEITVFPYSRQQMARKAVFETLRVK